MKNYNPLTFRIKNGVVLIPERSLSNLGEGFRFMSLCNALQCIHAVSWYKLRTTQTVTNKDGIVTTIRFVGGHWNDPFI